MKALHSLATWSAALMLAATVTQSASAGRTETIHRSYDTRATPRLSVENINGDLAIDGWDQNRIEISAVKQAPTSERLDDLRVTMEQDGDDVTIRVEYPRQNNFTDGEGPRVDFTIHVPRGTRVARVEFVNGDVDISGVSGDVEASSVNGGISGEKLGGHVDLSTVNGGVKLLAVGGAGPIRLNSVNGDVTLILPKQFDARIVAGTLHGDITAIDGIDVDAKQFAGSSMRGVIGKGTMKVDLNTVNGSIDVRREGEGGGREKL